VKKNDAKNPAAEPEMPVVEAAPALRHKARLARIAGALASGATVTEIAADEGISRVMASRDANSAECRQLIADFVNEEHELMLALFYRSLRTIEEALDAKREYTTRDGGVFEGGPDHYARLAATKHFRDFLTAGRPPASQIEEKRRTFTLDEIEWAIQDHKKRKQAERAEGRPEARRIV
jgi:hypothetical protein